ncbi:MAG TPA: MFS transporter [Longimicrobiaceae bacterium]|nr:MFS transporter [Longimicrobiaceae bacterium]
MTTSERSPGRVLGLLFLGVLMAALDIAIIGPALPAIGTSFGVDARTVAWVISLYLIFDLIGTPLLASLSDARGRRSIYVLSVGLFATGSLVVALSPTFGVLLAGRALQGFGAGGIFPVASAVIGDLFPVERRGRALGLIGAVFGLAFLIGPVLGGVLLRFGWPVLFLVNLPLAALVIAGALRLLPDTRAEHARKIDVPGLALLSLIVFGLAFGLNRIDAAHVGASLASPLVWGFLGGGALLMPLFWRRERRAPSPMLRPEFLGRRQVKLACALALGAGLTEASVVFAPALLVADFHVSVERASFMLLPIVVAMALGAPAAGRMLDRVGSRAVILSGTILIGVGLLLVGVVGHTVAGFYLAGATIGLGLAALVGSSLRYVILNEAPAGARGVTQGVLTIFTTTGQLVGAALIGALVASHGGLTNGYVLAFDVVGAVMLALAAAALGLKSRPQELAAAAAPQNAQPAV